MSQNPRPSDSLTSRVNFLGLNKRKRVRKLGPKRPIYYQIDKNKNEIDSYWKKQYKLVSNMPLLWLDRAMSLKLAGDTLYNLFTKKTMLFSEDEALMNEGIIYNGLQPIYMMIYGYAFECLLKGNYVKYKHITDENGSLLSWWKNHGHDLCAITSKVNKEADGEIIVLDTKDSLLFERLNVFVLWAGRYPIPVKYTDKMPVKFEDNSAAPLHFITSGDKKRIDELFVKISDILSS